MSSLPSERECDLVRLKPPFTPSWWMSSTPSARETEQAFVHASVCDVLCLQLPSPPARGYVVDELHAFRKRAQAFFHIRVCDVGDLQQTIHASARDVAGERVLKVPHNAPHRTMLPQCSLSVC